VDRQMKRYNVPRVSCVRAAGLGCAGGSWRVCGVWTRAIGLSADCVRERGATAVDFRA
jgi:hypothetical protein